MGDNAKGFEGDQPLVGLSLDNSSFKLDSIVRQDLPGVPGTFVLRNVLTPNECSMIINHIFSESGDQLPSSAKPILFRGWAENPEEEYKKLGRRAFFRSEEFATQLYHRVFQHLPKEAKIVTGTEQRDWKVHSMSERVRFVRYEAGQAFPPHTDGPEVRGANIRSFYSILFYLDSGSGSKFSGGELRFLRALNDKTSKTGEAETEVITEVVPEAGMVIVLPHRTLHQSAPLSTGRKYVIRNDILFSLCDDIPPRTVPEGSANDPSYLSIM